jgi:glutamate synthase domain-containing protein 1
MMTPMGDSSQKNLNLGIKLDSRFVRPYMEKDISGCSLSGFINEDGEKVDGSLILKSITVMHERSNGLGGGFAAYGIYPDYKDYYALHLMFSEEQSRKVTEQFLEENLFIEVEERLPTRNLGSITNPPILWRYFVKPKHEMSDDLSDEFIVQTVTKINSEIDGAFVMSSGKNMGVFKAVGFPEDVGKFYRIEEYEGYVWIAHGRFPTNTPGWWGGAHPFSLLDWAVIHNGEISSYGTNKRYLKMFGYKCMLMTDTEVVAYLFDLLARRHRLPIEIVPLILAPPFWSEIDRLSNSSDNGFSDTLRALRMVYKDAMLNGPWAIIVGYKNGLIGLNDRIKLRPLVAARKKNTLYIASEESGIHEICNNPDDVWAPIAGEPVMGRLKVK